MNEDAQNIPEQQHSDLLQAALGLAANLNLAEVLQEFVDQACKLTGAKYAALSVLDNRGETSEFVYHGMPVSDSKQIGHPPIGRGIIGAIPSHGSIIVNDLANSDLFTGFPASHPRMNSFFGAPVRMHEQVYGRLYLCDKEGGFSEDDAATIEGLAAVAAVAIENSKLYAESRNRERWIKVSQQLTTTLLQGTDEEEALEAIAHEIRLVAEADTAIIVLPSVGDTWACEFADGYKADTLLGVVFPPEGRAMTVLSEGAGMVVDSLQRAQVMRIPELAEFGPALYAPLLSRRTGNGVLLLLRLPDGPEFEPSDLALAESVAAQAALALELAGARNAEDMANLLDERARIGRDLHDLAIQQLFATGMQISAARNDMAKAMGEDSEVVRVLENALASVDDSVGQIRQIVRNLREPDQSVGIIERLRREASLSRTGLGFAPSLVITVDGTTLASSETDIEKVGNLDYRIGPDIADDVVAVVREGLSNCARHAHANAVQVKVTVDGDAAGSFIEVQVCDDGRGLDPAVTRRSGIDNLRARARRHDGTMEITEPETGSGLCLKWRCPLK